MYVQFVCKDVQLCALTSSKQLLILKQIATAFVVDYVSSKFSIETFQLKD